MANSALPFLFVRNGALRSPFSLLPCDIAGYEAAGYRKNPPAFSHPALASVGWVVLCQVELLLRNKSRLICDIFAVECYRRPHTPAELLKDL